MTVGEVKQRQRQAWAAGDYRTAGARIQIVSEMLCEAVDLRGGQTVLDVATGTGNTAIAAARRWCEVAAIDYVPSLLEIGRVRAAAEGVPVAFLEGDAEEIGFPDNAFDVVLSTLARCLPPTTRKRPTSSYVCAALEGKSGWQIGRRRDSEERFLVPLRNWFPLHKGRNLQAFGVRKIICGSFSETASPWRSSPSTSSSAIVHRPIGSKYFRPHSVQLRRHWKHLMILVGNACDWNCIA